MSELKESLYDTTDAIALSLQLSSAGTGATSEVYQNDSIPYIRFSAGPRVAPPVPRPTPKPPAEATKAEPEISLPSEPFENGDEMLKWCIDAAGATHGFVIDSQGFVILREGEELTDDGYDGAGATLGLVVDQLNQLEIDGGEIQVADLIFQNRFMLVVHAKDKDNDVYNMGIIGSSPITTNQIKVIYQQVRRSLLQVAL
jgi:hypothetical protein